jgi:predicted permease
MNWRRFIRRDVADDEQREELDSYLDITAQEYVERGMPPGEARAAARRKLGNATLIREEIYRMNSVSFIEGFLRDARHAVRMIRTNPGFVLTIILSLAFGIGANTAIFSVVHGVLIQPLPYPHADALVGVYNRLTIQGQVFNDAALSPGMYAACKEACRSFENFGVWSSGAATVTGASEPEQVTTATVTRGVLPALGVPAFVGRWFSTEDDSPGGARTAILSHGYWQRKFGADPGVLGQTVVIDFMPHTVIGVMPQDFRFVKLSPDVILPQRFPPGPLRPEPMSYTGIGRLKSGIAIETANQDTAHVWRNWGEAEGASRMLNELAVTPNLRPLKNDVVGDAGAALQVIMGSLGLVLLLVCANVANLVIVRARARKQEFAIRAALGAGWGRIVREQLVENLTLGMAGGTLGLGFAYLGIQLLVANGPAGLPRLQEIALTPAVIAFALVCSLGASLLFGSMAVIKTGVGTRVAGTRGATQAREHLRAQRLLVVGQMAMALVLIVASGLMARTLIALQGVTPGFTRPEQIQMVRISIPEALAREPERVIRTQKEIYDRLAALAGVSAAGFASALPLEEYRNGIVVAVEGKTDPDHMPPNRAYKHASPGLFAAQGSRMVAGREFTWDDVFDRRRLAIVSENMARESWGDARAAIGKRIRIGRDAPWSEVVGVVEDVYAYGLHQPAPPTVYARAGVEAWPDGSTSIRRAVTFAVRSPRAGSETFIKDVAAAVHAANPNLPLAQVRTLDDAYRRSMARTSFTVVLLGIAGAMALALAILGVYGVLAYAVSERRREVGIRLALGAQPSAVRSLFLRQGLALALIGSVLGLAAAGALSRWISSLLFGVKPLDPVTYTVAAAIIAAAAMLASYLPARRAASVDPMETLRSDV